MSEKKVCEAIEYRRSIRVFDKEKEIDHADNVKYFDPNKVSNGWETLTKPTRDSDDQSRNTFKSYILPKKLFNNSDNYHSKICFTQENTNNKNICLQIKDDSWNIFKDE